MDISERRYRVLGKGRITFPTVTREMISNPEIIVKEKTNMRHSSIIGSLVAATALATSPMTVPMHRPAREAAIMPNPETIRRPGRYRSRKDKKRIWRQRQHGHTHFGYKGGSTKLGRRLYRKFQLGMNGSY